MSKALESRRGQGRLAAVKFLFEREINHDEPLKEALEKHFEYQKIREGIAGYARKLVEGTHSHLKQIDDIITDNLKNWDLDRLARLDKTVIRVGVYELLYVDDVPSNVSINEMVEISKQYGSSESASFANGVLDAIRVKIETKS